MKATTLLKRYKPGNLLDKRHLIVDVNPRRQVIVIKCANGCGAEVEVAIKRRYSTERLAAKFGRCEECAKSIMESKKAKSVELAKIRNKKRHMTRREKAGKTGPIKTPIPNRLPVSPPSPRIAEALQVLESGKSFHQVSKQFGVSGTTVKYWFLRYKVYPEWSSLNNK